MTETPLPPSNASWLGPDRPGGSAWYGGLGAFRLTESFRPALRSHFDRLNPEDLHLRFGTHCRPEVLDHYVAGIDFSESVVLGVCDDDLELVGVVHLSPQDDGWELGLSVLPGWRRRGIGASLLRRSIRLARVAGAHHLFAHCLSENHALVRLVRKVGAEIVQSDGEAEGVIAIPPALPIDGWVDLAEEHLSLLDLGLKAQLLVAKLWVPRVA